MARRLEQKTVITYPEVHTTIPAQRFSNPLLLDFVMHPKSYRLTSHYTTGIEAKTRILPAGPQQQWQHYYATFYPRQIAHSILL